MHHIFSHENFRFLYGNYSLSEDFQFSFCISQIYGFSQALEDHFLKIRSVRYRTGQILLLQTLKLSENLYEQRPLF